MENYLGMIYAIGILYAALVGVMGLALRAMDRAKRQPEATGAYWRVAS